MMQIPFNIPFAAENSQRYLDDVIKSKRFEAGKYTQKASDCLVELTGARKVLLTNSCTTALELAATLIDLGPGDEVIMPSFTFVSTATAIVMRGATPVFVDIRSDTLNIDEKLIEQAITPRTKAIIPVHYAGVACDMDAIMTIADKHNLFVIEDAAQAINASYKGLALGAIGHFGAFSFHQTKNITSGLGGALLINDEHFVDRAKIVWQKGTNREAFLEGKVDKYSWVDIGSSFMPSELTAAMLWAQLEQVDFITKQRLAIWHQYLERFKKHNANYKLPVITSFCHHNAHLFYLLLESEEVRREFIKYMANNGVETSFHYVPLHTSSAGKRFAKFNANDLTQTVSLSKRLVRLPLYADLKSEEVDRVIDTALHFLVDHSS